MKKFKLRGYKEKEYFMVYVYDSLSDLRLAAAKFRGEENLGDALAVVQPYLKTRIKPEGEETSSDIGIIRLTKGYIQTYIVAHELIHAALWHYRLTQSDEIANFGKENSEKEEDFGFIYAKYFSQMNKQLYKHKLWNT